jgi:transposase
MTVPGVGWVTAYTIASEIGDIGRFASPKKLTGYTGLCPIVRQSGPKDRRGPLAKNGPKYLRWALIEAATHAARDARYRDRYERTKHRLGRQRGAKVARVDIARQLAEAIWHVLSKNEPFARQAPLSNWSRDDPYRIGPPEQPPTGPCPSSFEKAIER